VVVKDKGLWDLVLIVSNWDIWPKIVRWALSFLGAIMETREVVLRDMEKRRTDFFDGMLFCCHVLLYFKDINIYVVNVKMI